MDHRELKRTIREALLARSDPRITSVRHIKSQLVVTTSDGIHRVIHTRILGPETPFEVDTHTENV
jgi:hypothetical protein